MHNNYKSGKVIIAVKREIASTVAIYYYISSALDGIEYEKIETIFHVNKPNSELDIILIYLKDNNPDTVKMAVERLSASPNIIFAEPDYIEEMHIVSNDPLYDMLWGLQRIHAPLAWNYTTGNASIAVGVIDSGIDHNHPDIIQNMWRNEGTNLSYGWNFADNDINSTDTNGHGTHVAGTIGAVGNNNIGITGVCWNISVVSMKFGLDVASAIASIEFAIQFNIPILNASWGGTGYSKALKYAIEQYDGLFIASAGNNGSNNDIEPIYPASYDCKNIISVAATNPNDELASFSNYGMKSVDIAAPGTDILSLDLYNNYSPLSGTSMAAPHVAGVAALLKSCMPTISTQNLKEIILSSVDKKSNLSDKLLTGGVLDANAAIRLANYSYTIIY